MARNPKKNHKLTGEDAKVLAYATFGTNLPGTFVGCERLVTLDKGLANEFELKKKNLETKLRKLKKRLATPYQEARLPEVVVLESEVRPEYLKKLEKIRDEPIIRFGNTGDFRKRYGLK